MNLLLYNLKTDVDDPVLGFGTDWINALSAHFDKVFVVTMCEGRKAVKDNVSVFSVGKEKGYSELRRLFEFYRILFSLFRQEKIDACFAHMMPLFAVLGWPLTAIRRIPIVLWYGHKATPVTLRFAHHLVDKVVTSHRAGFGLKSDKVVVVGQGITEEKFSKRVAKRKSDALRVISVGRITPIKHTKELLGAVKEFVSRNGEDSIRLVLLGDAATAQDQGYKEELLRWIAEKKMGRVVNLPGAVPHAEVAHWLEESDVSVNLCPTGAIDKAALESLALKIPLLFHNQSFTALFRESGVNPDVFTVPNLDPGTLCGALEFWRSRTSREIEDEMEKVSQNIFERHGLKGLAGRIAAEIKSLTPSTETMENEFKPILR